MSGKATAKLLDYPRISRERELELGPLIAEGNRAAIDELVLANTRLAAMIAKRYKGRGASYDDLFAAALLGLVQGAPSFDPKISRASTFLGDCCRQRINECLAKTCMLPMAATTNGLAMRYRKLKQRLGREPSDQEASKWLNVPVGQLPRIREAYRARQLGRLSRFPTLQRLHLDELVAPEAEVMDLDSQSESLHRAIRKLESNFPRHAKAIRMKFGFGCEASTLETIGNSLGVTKERARQIVEVGLKKIANYMSQKEALQNDNH